MFMDITSEGIDQLDRELQALPFVFEEEIFRRGLIAGAETFQKELILVAPRYKRSGPNRLHRNIKVRRRKKRFRGVTAARAARAAGQARPTARRFFRGAQVRAAVPHAHLVEFGHGGPAPAPPHPFIRPALESVTNQSQMMDAIVRECRRRLRALKVTKAFNPNLNERNALRVLRRISSRF